MGLGLGGFCLLARNGLTMMHRFALSGRLTPGTEKEFIARWQVQFDGEPRFSWVTIELINVYEARLFWIQIRLWKRWSVKFVANLGWGLGLGSIVSQP